MIWLIAGIALWGIVHSWLASLPVKDAIRRVVGDGLWRAYRLAYNVFSVVSLAPILLITRFVPDRLLYVAQPPLLYILLAGQALAACGLLVAIRQTDAWALVGIKQLLGHDEDGRLVTSGLYRYVRHPMYFFALLVIWLSPVMSVNVLVAFAALTGYFLIGAYFEERKLTRIFGAAYQDYQKRTPMLLPWPGPAGPKPQGSRS